MMQLCDLAYFSLKSRGEIGTLGESPRLPLFSNSIGLPMRVPLVEKPSIAVVGDPLK